MGFVRIEMKVATRKWTCRSRIGTVPTRGRYVHNLLWGYFFSAAALTDSGAMVFTLIGFAGMPATMW